MRKMPMVGVRVWLKALGMHADEAGGSSRTKKKQRKGWQVKVGKNAEKGGKGQGHSEMIWSEVAVWCRGGCMRQRWRLGQGNRLESTISIYFYHTVDQTTLVFTHSAAPHRQAHLLQVTASECWWCPRQNKNKYVVIPYRIQDWWPGCIHPGLLTNNDHEKQQF